MTGDQLMGQPKPPPKPANSDDDDDEDKPKAYLHKHRYASSLLVLAATFSILGCLVGPWWSWSLNTTSQSATYYFFSWGIYCFGASCPGSSSALNPATIPGMTTGSFLSNLGTLYTIAIIIGALAIVFSVIACLLLFRIAQGKSDNKHAVDHAIWLCYVAAALAVAMPVLIGVAQPSTLGADYQFPQGITPNPATQFSGSLGPTQFGNASLTGSSWGPSVSWYLSMLPIFLLFAAGLYAHLTRSDAATRRELVRAGLIKPPWRPRPRPQYPYAPPPGYYPPAYAPPPAYAQAPPPQAPPRYALPPPAAQPQYPPAMVPQRAALPPPNYGPPPPRAYANAPPRAMPRTGPAYPVSPRSPAGPPPARSPMANPAPAGAPGGGAPAGSVWCPACGYTNPPGLTRCSLCSAPLR